jgi:hypothetical protein
MTERRSTKRAAHHRPTRIYWHLGGHKKLCKYVAPVEPVGDPAGAEGHTDEKPIDVEVSGRSRNSGLEAASRFVTSPARPMHHLVFIKKGTLFGSRFVQ